MSDGLRLDTSAFASAIRQVERATGRAAMDSLNRAALTTIIGAKGVAGAMKLTPKADKAAIAALTDEQLRGAVVKRARDKGNWPLTSAEIKKLVKKERAKRKRASGYTAFAGWNNASKAFGGRGIGSKLDSARFAQSEAKKGSGTKATAADLAARLVNAAPMADQIGRRALQQAIDNAAADLVVYAMARIQRAFAGRR